MFTRVNVQLHASPEAHVCIRAYIFCDSESEIRSNAMKNIVNMVEENYGVEFDGRSSVAWSIMVILLLKSTRQLKT
jgi:hypothetical protein